MKEHLKHFPVCKIPNKIDHFSLSILKNAVKGNLAYFSNPKYDDKFINTYYKFYDDIILKFQNNGRKINLRFTENPEILETIDKILKATEQEKN